MIKKTNLDKLRLMAFSQVMKNVQAFLEKETNLQEKGLAEVKTEFDTAFDTLEEALQKTKKNEQTNREYSRTGQTERYSDYEFHHPL